MSRLFKLIVFVFLALLPSLVFAQAPDDQGSNFTFTPPVTDLSVKYLGQIFGTVGTVLHGTSGQMLGQLFKIFNLGLLVVAGLFLVYTITMTILNTAHEGEFMGRKFNSAWVALRTVLGLGLLVPSATTGYSLIQVIVMWVVIQGAGFANMAWQSALTYLAQGGQVYTPPSTNTSSMINAAGTILQSQVCMYTNQNIFLQHQKTEQQAQQQQQAQAGQGANTTNTATPQTPGTTYVQQWAPFFTVVQDGATYRSVVKFPGNPYNQSGQQDGACGQIAFGSGTQNDLNQDQKASTLKAAVNQMMLDLDSYAQQIATQLAPPPQAKNNAGQSNQNFANQVQGALVGAAADWVNTTLPIRSESTEKQKSSDLLEQYVANAASQGWIMAGKFYYALGNIQQKISEATSVSVNLDFYPAGFPGAWSPDNAKVNPNQSYIDFSGDQPNPVPSTVNMKGLSLSAQDQSTLLQAETNTASFVHPAIALAKQADNQSGQLPPPSGADAGILSFMFNPASQAMYQSFQDFYTATGDPILVIQDLGHKLLAAAITTWLLGTAAVFGLGVVSSVWASWFPFAYGVMDALLAFIPIFTIFILALGVLGGIFSLYVPLIPYIIFTFSAVGWLIAVVEAMVAAPLVALGVTHPEGHDLLGKSEQAILLLLSVFLRPVLMVIGLIAGIVFSRVVLRFLNTGFFEVVISSVGKNLSVFFFVIILFIYASLLITVVNQSFSLIYVIPDRVMRWLGITEQTTTAQEALQAAKQGYEQIAGATEKLGGSMIQSQGEKMAQTAARYREAGGPGGATTGTGGGGGRGGPPSGGPPSGGGGGGTPPPVPPPV